MTDFSNIKETGVIITEENGHHLHWVVEVVGSTYLILESLKTRACCLVDENKTIVGSYSIQDPWLYGYIRESFTDKEVSNLERHLKEFSDRTTFPVSIDLRENFYVDLT